MEQDKSWLYMDRMTHAFDNGLKEFLRYAQQFRNSEGKIRCPCRKCYNTISHTLDDVYAHCFDWGWAHGYTTWFYHGETKVSRKRSRTTQVVVEAGGEMAPVINDFLGGPPEEGIDEDDHERDDDISEGVPQPPPPKKKQGERGCAKGLNVQALKRRLGTLIPIIWDPRFPNVRKAVGQYSAEFESELGKVMRKYVPCYTPTWSRVPDQKKELIWQELRSSFTPLEPHIHRPAVLAECSDLFRKWKGRLKRKVDTHVAEGRPGPCPKSQEVDSQEEWEEFLCYINSPAFKKKSDQNKMNRSGQKYTCKQGRRPMCGVRWLRLNMDNIDNIEQENVGRDPIEVWGEKHTNEDGTFVNANAEADYRTLLEVAARIAPDTTRTFEDEEQIFNEALGSRRDYSIGLGRKQTSRSGSSSQSFQIPSSSTCHRDCNTKIVQLEKTLQKTQKKSKKQEAILARLLSNLQARMPDLPVEVIPESSDADESLDLDDN